MCAITSDTAQEHTRHVTYVIYGVSVTPSVLLTATVMYDVFGTSLKLIFLGKMRTKRSIAFSQFVIIYIQTIHHYINTKLLLCIIVLNFRLYFY